MGVRRVGGTALKPAPSAQDYDVDEDEVTSVFEEEDEDETALRSHIVQSGRDAARKAAESGSEFISDFKFSEDPQLIKFMSDEPIAVYKQHWINERQGRKSFTCLKEKCPLCRRAGHKAQQKYGYSIVNITGADEPIPQLLAVGLRAWKQLDALNEGRTGPLSKGYWAVSRTGSGNTTTFAFVPVKDRDLAEDWEIDAESVTQALDQVVAVDGTAIRIDSLAELNEIAKEIT